MAIWFFILVSFLFGCASGVEIDGSVQIVPTTFYPADPADMADVEQMVERLRAATGRDDLRVAPGGVRISIEENVVVAAGPACAGTFRRADGKSAPFIQVRGPAAPEGKYCMDRVSTMLHEAIHVLAPESRHSETGVFREKANRDSRLDSASLEALCADFACSAFVPESQL